MDDESEYKQRELAYYSAMLNAWLTTKLERDKHLLSLATFALGLIVTLATTVGFKNPYSQILVLSSAICFCFTVFSILRIFEVNAEIVTSTLKNNEEQSKANQKSLTRLDIVASVNFKVGVVLLFLAAISVVITTSGKETQMNTNKPQQTTDTGDKQIVKNSWDTVSELKPVRPQQPSNESGSDKKKD